jgi:hypothetical protein
MLSFQSVPRTSSRVFRRWIIAVALCAGLSARGEALAESRDASSPDVRQDDAVLIGSSSFNQAFGLIIVRELERMGYQVTRKGVSGAGLARPDYHDMNQVLEATYLGALRRSGLGRRVLATYA